MHTIHPSKKWSPDTVEIIRTQHYEVRCDVTFATIFNVVETLNKDGRRSKFICHASPDYFNRTTHPLKCQASLRETMLTQH